MLSPLTAEGIGLHESTYTAEIYRAGIENVDRRTPWFGERSAASIETQSTDRNMTGLYT
ncbi:hypothetical protein [Roseovarius pelagicus]|uniref:Uncharacterized protein n=1 Tax=Roseovarius pelagicus TaxID=2980108 RepID=A0ABY6D6I3_9RHOB|nr:hypothetical protein [Roseovarius pelagicus]UXX81741.1 hypothetical protein N7U68_11425 [Roseovarius pelagicus]